MDGLTVRLAGMYEQPPELRLPVYTWGIDFSCPLVLYRGRRDSDTAVSIRSKRHGHNREEMH